MLSVVVFLFLDMKCFTMLAGLSPPCSEMLDLRCLLPSRTQDHHSQMLFFQPNEGTLTHTPPSYHPPKNGAPCILMLIVTHGCSSEWLPNKICDF